MDRLKLMKIGLVLGGSLIAFFVVLAIVRHLSVAEELPGTTAAPTVEASASGGAAPKGSPAPVPAAANGNNPAEEHLSAAFDAMDKASQALAKASTSDHGGFVERARAETRKAIADLTDALHYVNAHPEISGQPALASADAQAAADHAKSLSFPKPNGQGNMDDALDALQGALEAVEAAPGGNLGGQRDILLLDIDQAASDVSAGFTYKRIGGKRNPAAVPATENGLP